MNRACRAGDSSTEPYIATHNLLLSHAAAVDVYRENISIGVTLVTWWMEPYSNQTADQDAANLRSIGVTLVTWWMEPYSNQTADQDAANRALYFYYGCSRYVRNVETVDPERISYTNDAHAELLYENSEGQSIGPVRNIGTPDLRFLRLASTSPAGLIHHFDI
ncbi:hypothetical protein Tsubulata_030803 [Turnera subulata]|uniref:Uncharacterized protein n=1 Tax=Turnera subulata TaxID=218843 RepID=A0A9Q0FUW9_9ROSI|nr:hypothetical protein Tsubulata_030803 [Turnera subulata]